MKFEKANAHELEAFRLRPLENDGANLLLEMKTAGGVENYLITTKLLVVMVDEFLKAAKPRPAAKQKSA
jgi:hypothetical protein